MQSFDHILKSGRIRLLGLLLFLWSSSSVAEQVEVRVKGDFPGLQKNAEAFIGEVKGRSADNLRRYASTAVSQASKALRALGYYSPVVDWKVEEADAEKTAKLVLEITPGDPVRVKSRTIEIRGPAASDSRFKDNLPVHPAEGDILNHGDYTSLRNTLQTRARRRGYFDGRLVTRTLEVDPEALSANIVLVFESGDRYRLGEVSFEEGHWFESRLLQEFVTFEPGIPYHADEIAKLNSDLLGSGYFSGVDIDAVPGSAENGVIPVRIGLTRRDPRSLAAGLGFSTDVGPRFRGTWREHWINPMGHKRGAETELSGPRQNISTWYELPLDPPMTDAIRLTAGYQREDIENVESELLTFGQQWQHQLDSGWLQVLSIRWDGERYNIGDDEKGTSSLLLPGVGYSKLHADSPLDPSKGYRLQIDVSGSHRAALSSVDILHVNAIARGLFTLGGRHRFLSRVQIGGVGTNRFEDVPPSLRFFAGGDQSVRGYAYQSLSPENDNGVPVGGRYTLVGSAEYQYQFADRWRSAMFIDHGNAVNDLFDPLATGVGVGIRWISPLGPLRLDIAKGLDTELGGEWRIHFSMGPEL
ncbi:MAG: outer membrane protein assembly factor [Marinobacter sp.]|uniref:autotransporter assembly complex protein TamA n=1 Tax=Marinobacter sp. TaxID=50741 RepID=UPI001B55A515|nr:autotransporter assembly complex family protein [Marinobacter sp.]MBQ0746344.1 outer membrane protein assembly factor [Marinobacter sp.]MBQ0814832.1 outer membrane protein assembly factor [Marinobacter sp.]|tara:strand:- start:609 stop:2363 length:1755 start_codon:yes stop_codon:yes gene_type:complete